MKKELTTLFTGRHCTVLTSIDSTNSYLSGILRGKLLPEGSVIRTLEQHAGRGVAGARWESEMDKNILMSLAFYPSFVSPREAFLLNKTYAMGVFDFVQSILEDDVYIKWPNDIYWKNKKVAGLLIENSIYLSAISSSILGIGLNVNQKTFPASVPNPVSLSMITEKEYDLDEVFSSLCGFIEARYLQLKRGETFEIEDDYLMVLYRLDEWAKFISGGKEFKGCIRGVNESGKLEVETEKEGVRTFDMKEIKFVL